MSLAPIIVFAFNRLEPLKKCIESLLTNEESKYSDLFIFVDGPRPSVLNEHEQIKQVKDYVKQIVGFKSLNIVASLENKGLAKSVITGVSSVINEYKKVIVVEDDLIVSSCFLNYMNTGLDKYEEDSKVFSICGYSVDVKIPNNYMENTYIAPRSGSWGWATWKDRWNKVNWDLKDWNIVTKNKYKFNRWGGSDLYHMLKSWKRGKVSSWAIRFCYSQFILDSWSLFPCKSLVKNNGFDGNGTNCPQYNRAKIIFDDTKNIQFRFPDIIEPNKSILKEVLKYNTIFARIKSKIINFIFFIRKLI